MSKAPIAVDASNSNSLSAYTSCAVYACCSVGMVLANKAISSCVDDKVPLPQVSIIWFQCVFALIMVEFAKLMDWVNYPSFSLEVAKSWVPLNLLFIGMLYTGFMSLVHASIPMVTIFKNLTNVITVAGDGYFFNEPVSRITYLSVMVMVVGAIMAGVNDLEFSFEGYFWMLMNCVCTAGYTLYMRFASKSIQIPKFGMVFYNNLLSAAFLLPVAMLRGEFSYFVTVVPVGAGMSIPSFTATPLLSNFSFLVMNIVAGFCGFYLNFAALWCISETSATTFAIIGSLNKIPITFLGFMLFDAKMTSNGISFVMMSTLGGLLYAYAKFTATNGFGSVASPRSIQTFHSPRARSDSSSGSPVTLNGPRRSVVL